MSVCCSLSLCSDKFHAQRPKSWHPLVPNDQTTKGILLLRGVQGQEKTGKENKKRKQKTGREKPCTGLLLRAETVILCFAVCAMRIGSCAILRCEPCQVLTEAAVSACEDVLQGCPV